MRHVRQPEKQYVEVGDRVVVSSGRLEIAPLRGKSATVVAVFDAPRGSAVVRVLHGGRTQDLFVYRGEIAERGAR